MRIVFCLALCLLASFVSGQELPQQDRFAPVLEFLKQSVQAEKVAGGSLLVFQKGKIVLETAFGFSDLKSKTLFEVETPVVIASISKPLIGTTLYRLVDEGNLDVKAPISEYLPEFVNPKLESGENLNRVPCVTDLLTHSAGLRSDYEKSGRIWFQSWTKKQSLEFVVKKVAKDIPFKNHPGAKYAYSGIGTDIAARVGEVTSGMSRNDLLVAQVSEPLGMNSTFYSDSEGIKKLKSEMPTQYYIDKKSQRLKVSKKREVPEPNQYNSSGGSVISTAPDLLKWLLMLRGGGKLDSGEVYLSPDSFQAMLKKHPVGYNAAGGLFVRGKDKNGKPSLFSHTGSSGTSVWIDFERDAIGIMLTQTRGSDIRDFRIKLESKVKTALFDTK